jgi:DNA ligase-1
MEPQLLTVIEQEELKTWDFDDKKWSNWQIEPKRDGFRLLIVDGVPQSRSGKPLHNIQHILDEMGPTHMRGLVFDGELHGDTWEQTSHVARASKSEREEKLTYTIFDQLAYKSEWLKQSCDRTLTQRQELMRKYMVETEHVKFVKPIECRSSAMFDGIHRAHLLQGCDGTVLKRKDSVYEFKRTKTWLKVKPALDVDCKVIGMEDGEGKHKGRMGALIVMPENSCVSTKVGTGFTDADRQWWHENLKKMVFNTWIEVTYRKMNPSGRLVEPRFVRIRHDKNLT